MTTAKALETAIASYLGTLDLGATIYQHISPADPMTRPAIIVSDQGATEDEWMRGIYRGSILCQLEAHAQGTATEDVPTPDAIRALHGQILEALRCEEDLTAYVGRVSEPWAPLHLRYAIAIDEGATEQDGVWVLGVSLEYIAHR